MSQHPPVPGISIEVVIDIDGTQLQVPYAQLPAIPAATGEGSTAIGDSRHVL